MEAIAALAYVEMLERGFTRVGEFHYLHHDPPARLTPISANSPSVSRRQRSETGIGLTLLPVFYAHSNFGGVAAGHRASAASSTASTASRTSSKRMPRAIANLDDANFGVAPHSLRAATPEELRAIVPLAQGGPIHIHAAEQTKEVDDCIAWSGARPVEWLLEHAHVDRHWCLVHATHMTPRRRNVWRKAARWRGCVPSRRPISATAYFRPKDYLAAGGRFGIGTDSNVQIDAAGELRALEYAQRLTHACPQCAGRSAGPFHRARTVRRRAGGRRPGAGHVHRGLREGASADIVSLDEPTPALAGRKGDAVARQLDICGRRHRLRLATRAQSWSSGGIVHAQIASAIPGKISPVS